LTYGTKSKKLLERVRETIRLKHYSQKTEQVYLNWIIQSFDPEQRNEGAVTPLAVVSDAPRD